MITTLFLTIAQAAMVGPPDIVQIPEDTFADVAVEEHFPPDHFVESNNMVGSIRAGVESGLDVISVDGPGITMFVDPQSSEGAVFMFGGPSLVPVPTQAEKDELMRQAREDAERRWAESHPE